MSLVTFFYQNQPRGKIGDVAIDVTIADSVDYSCSISKNPVEDGSFVSDHITIEPKDIGIKGLITNYPLFSDEGSDDRVKNAYEELLVLKTNKTPFTVVTGLDIYPNVFFTKFSINRDADTGNALSFDARFQEIIFAVPVTVKIDRDKVRQGKKDFTQSDVNKGADQASNAAEKRENLSLLYKLFRPAITGVTQ